MKFRRDSFQGPSPIVHWLAAASLLFGCATANSARPTSPDHTTNATPVVIIASAPNTTETPVTSDEPPEAEAAPNPSRANSPLVGQRAPRIDAEFVSGNGPTTIGEAQGKVILIDFWATFCAPCRSSLPQYQALADQFPGELVVIAVSVDDSDTDQARLQDFAQATGVKFPVVWDKAQLTARAYRLPKMPTSFIVDRMGVVRFIHAGYGDKTAEEMARQIRSLIAK